MPRRKRKSDANKLKAGYGTGRGGGYIPYLKTRDVPSLGLSHRILGIKTGRIHHLLSNLEKNYFLLLDFSPHVSDIREQYPLSLEKTLAICNRFNLRHPIAGQPAKPIVMTTDFLITTSEESQLFLARTVKPADRLSSRRTLEKLEIERIYWSELGIDWGIVTDYDLPKDRCRNLDWLHPAYFPAESQKFPSEILLQTELLLFEWNRHMRGPFTALTKAVDKKLCLPPGSSLWMARHFIATQLWIIDLSKPLLLDKPIEIERTNELKLRRLVA